MSAELIIGTVVGLGTLFFMWQQNRILQRQNEIFAREEGVKTAADVGGAKYRRYWPMLAMGVLMLLTWGAVAVDYYFVRQPFDSNKAWDDTAPLRRVYHQTFTNETVPLDGYDYIDSTFDRVSFEYEGRGAVGINQGTFIRHPGEVVFRLGSKNKIVTETMMIEDLLMRASGCRANIENLGPTGNIYSISPPSQ